MELHRLDGLGSMADGHHHSVVAPRRNLDLRGCGVGRHYEGVISRYERRCRNRLEDPTAIVEDLARLAVYGRRGAYDLRSVKLRFFLEAATTTEKWPIVIPPT